MDRRKGRIWIGVRVGWKEGQGKVCGRAWRMSRVRGWVGGRKRVGKEMKLGIRKG